MSDDYRENVNSDSSDEFYGDYSKNALRKMMENHTRNIENSETNRGYESEFEKTTVMPRKAPEPVHEAKPMHNINSMPMLDDDDDIVEIRASKGSRFTLEDAPQTSAKDMMPQAELVQPEPRAQQPSEPVNAEPKRRTPAFPSATLTPEEKPVRKMEKIYVDVPKDDDEEQVRVIKHKERPKTFKRRIGAAEPDELEDIKKTVSQEKDERRRRMENQDVAQRPRQRERNRDMYDETQYRRKKNRSSDKLDMLRTPNEARKQPQKTELSGESKKFIVIVAVAAIVFLFLFVRNITLTSKVHKLNEQLVEMEEIKAKNEEYKLNIVSLQEQLKEGASATESPENGENTPDGENSAGTNTENNSQNGDSNASNGQYDTYTIVAGDTLSGISQKVYGNYSGYKRILDANGLTENSNLQIGDTLKIPK